MRTVTFGTLNAHLFGQTGMINGRRTGLNYYDDPRAAFLAARLPTMDPLPDVLCLQEVWDRRYRELLEGKLADLYPYHCHAPEANGIEEILTVIARERPLVYMLLKDRVGWLVRTFAQSHYDVAQSMWVGFLQTIFPKEDRFLEVLSEMLQKPKAWGAGLMILSRFPLDMDDPPGFTPHPTAAALERFAAKGVLRAVVKPPDMPPIRILTTHTQEGYSPAAVKARMAQFRGIHDLIPSPIQPTVVLGDFNVVAEDHHTGQSKSGKLHPTEEYLRMRRIMNRHLRDAFREVHPDPTEEPGVTYDHTSHFARQLGVADAPSRARQRLDCIFHTAHFGTRRALVDHKHLHFRDGYLSDHFLLSAELFLKGGTA